MTSFSLELAENAGVLERLLIGRVCLGCVWRPSRNGWSRAETELTFDELRLVVTTRLDGGTVRWNGQEWSLKVLSCSLVAHVKAAAGQRVKQCSVSRVPAGGSRAIIEVVFENGVVLVWDARPLPDTICTTDLPFTQYVGATPIDSAQPVQLQMAPVTSIPGFVPALPEKTKLRVVQ